MLTRYYKFLIVNVLVFFCVGTAALQSFLNSFRNPGKIDVINTVATSFPTAGPFYVGWRAYAYLWCLLRLLTFLWQWFLRLLFTEDLSWSCVSLLDIITYKPMLIRNNIVGVSYMSLNSPLQLTFWSSYLSSCIPRLHDKLPRRLPIRYLYGSTNLIDHDSRKRDVGIRPRTFNFYCEIFPPVIIIVWANTYHQTGSQIIPWLFMYWCYFPCSILLYCHSGHFISLFNQVRYIFHTLYKSLTLRFLGIVKNQVAHCPFVFVQRYWLFV